MLIAEPSLVSNINDTSTKTLQFEQWTPGEPKRRGLGCFGLHPRRHEWALRLAQRPNSPARSSEQRIEESGEGSCFCHDTECFPQQTGILMEGCTSLSACLWGGGYMQQGLKSVQCKKKCKLYVNAFLPSGAPRGCSLLIAEEDFFSTNSRDNFSLCNLWLCITVYVLGHHSHFSSTKCIKA